MVDTPQKRERNRQKLQRRRDKESRRKEREEAKLHVVLGPDGLPIDPPSAAPQLDGPESHVQEVQP